MIVSRNGSSGISDWSERVARETRARERDRPNPPLTYGLPKPMASPARGFGTIPAADFFLRPAGLERPATITVMDTKLPPRTPAHEQAVQDLGVMQGPWHEPPLVMARTFKEPSRAFGRYLDASTMSVHKPPGISKYKNQNTDDPGMEQIWCTKDDLFLHIQTYFICEFVYMRGSGLLSKGRWEWA